MSTGQLWDPKDGSQPLFTGQLWDPKDGSHPLMLRSSASPRDSSPTPMWLEAHPSAHTVPTAPPIPCRWPYLRAFWSRCRQSMASGQCLRDCRKRCTWGRRMLLGGKSPVHNQSSSQPRSSLYLWEEAWCPGGLLTRAAHAYPRPHPSLRPTWTHPPDRSKSCYSKCGRPPGPRPHTYSSLKGKVFVPK